MLTSPEINEMYARAQLLVKIELPNRLWDGGTSAFKSAIDQIRSNQEQLSTMLLAVSREHLLIKRLMRSIRCILAAGVKSQDVVWPAGFPNMLTIEDHEQELSVLWNNLKLLHSELTRARSDLRSKIHLLEIEGRMGPSGVIPQDGIDKVRALGVNSIENEQDVEWDTLQDDSNTKGEQ